MIPISAASSGCGNGEDGWAVAVAIYWMIMAHRASSMFSFSSPRCYTPGVATAHTCVVSFTDTNGIRHAVEVVATTLYEAAVLAMAEFRRCGFTENAPGSATRLNVCVKSPSTSHEVQWGKVETWIQSPGKPNEQTMKHRLRELLRA